MKVRQHRIPHIMKPGRGIHHPSNFFFFDTETKDSLNGKGRTYERHKLWFGVVWAFRYDNQHHTREQVSIFNTVDAFYATLRRRLDKSRPLYVFAHNIPFDLTIVDFWHQSEIRGISFSYIVMEDPPIMLSCRWDDCTIIFLDTFNFWKCKVEDMGKSLGIKKLPMPKPNAPLKQWHDYCKRDVNIIGNQVISLLDFLTEYDLGTFGISAPSCAMNVFKKSFMKHEIFCHDRDRVLKLERDCYYGGLVNNFFVGSSETIELHYLDVNSLYPSVMLNPLPCKLIDDYKNPPMRRLDELGDSIGGCAYVRIKTNKRCYPKRYNGRLCEVTGSFDTSLCGRELVDARNAGDIANIYHLATYILQPIFRPFVEWFWQKRLEYKTKGETIKEQTMKLFLNSLYGKFGMKGYDWVDWSRNAIEDYYLYHGLECPHEYLAPDYQPMISQFTTDHQFKGIPHKTQLRYLGGTLQLKFPTGEHSESFCAVAAFVTSYARSVLRQLISIAGPNQTLYCDTDSVFVTNRGYQRLKAAKQVQQTTLGKLKWESSSCRWSFYGPKDYSFGDVVKLKGIKANAKRINANTFEQVQFEGLRSVLRRGGKAYIDITTIHKTNKRIINKGVLGNDGWVSPIILHE